MTEVSPPILEAVAIAKSYGPTCALRDATLRLRPGSVHALLGENGAGKSTFVKIIAGAARPDRGTLRLDGATLDLRSVRQAVTAGIVPIYQHLSLFPHLSVLENLSAFALGGGTRLTASHARISRAVATSWLAAVGLDLDLDQPAGELSLGERQLLEIARGLGQNCRVLVLDEPTAALTAEEGARLFAVVRRLRANGAAILFISHRLDEIDQLADTVTVLRDGCTVVEGRPLKGISRQELVEAMLGMAVGSRSREPAEVGTTVLRARRLRVSAGAPALDLEIGAGEIVGLAGLVGCGALLLAAALAGAHPAGGSLQVDDRALRPGDRVAASALGIGYVPSDRHQEGSFPSQSALVNASASSLAEDTRFAFVSRRAETVRIVPWLQRLRLNPLDPSRPIDAFSGGNQQKILLARALAMPNLRVLVLLEPTRGVDIAAREIIHDAVAEAAARGVAVVLASSDLDEVVALSTRILVIRGSAVAGSFRADADRSAILAAFAGMPAAA